jgi:hypothetical protein
MCLFPLNNLTGSPSQDPEDSFGDDDYDYIPRNYFYQHFLKQNRDLLQSFLNTWGWVPPWSLVLMCLNLTLTSSDPLSASEILDITDPSGTLILDNTGAHKISFRDVSRALSALTEEDPSQGALWTRFSVLVLGDDDVASWVDKDDKIGPAAVAHRKKLALVEIGYYFLGAY